MDERKSLGRQQRFAEEYSVDHNGSAAAVRAGYSRQSAKVTAARLLTKANVRRIVTARAAENAVNLALTRQQVVTDLRYAIELARIKGDPVAMIKGWREVAKLCGLYDAAYPQQSQSTPCFAALSDDQLVHLATSEPLTN